MGISNRRFRKGIKTFELLGAIYERCDEHNKYWPEGDSFERFGGQSCEKCILVS